MRYAALTMGAAALVLLTACGSQGARLEPVGPATPSTAMAGDASASASPGTLCADADSTGGTDAERAGVPLPADLAVAAIIECGVERRPLPGQGVWNFSVERRATTGIGDLVALLRRPDEARGTAACPMMLVFVPWLAVEDPKGRVVHVRIPRDSCGNPLGGVRPALDALALVEVSATRREQVQTPAEVTLEAEATATGCVSAFKDMVAITDGDRATVTSAPDPLLATPSGVVTVCRFSAGKDTDGMPLLSFTAGEKLSATATAALLRQLAASGPAEPCTAAHTQVTGLFTAQNGWALVEVDGCRRVESGDSGGWRQATPELLALLR